MGLSGFEGFYQSFMRVPKLGLLLLVQMEVGSCQNYGPFLGTPNIRCRTILGTQKGTIILTTTQVENCPNSSKVQITGPQAVLSYDIRGFSENKGP